jgi:peptidoglycan/LPS O-acetylase OafA/YrhL
MQHIKGFDAIRAMSVSLVVISHVGIIEAATNPALVHFFSVFNASLGVRAFFVLSGFLITTLLLQRYSKTGKVDIFDFMMRRAFRILPLYFVTLSSLLPLVYFGRWREAGEAAAYGVFFVYNFIPNELNVHYLSHLWSLGVEEQFYIVWPFLFATFALRRSVLISICAILVGLCWWRMMSGYGSEVDTHSPGRWTIPAVYPIALGAMLAIILDTQGMKETAREFVSSLPCLLFAVALILLPLTSNTTTIEFLGSIGIALGTGWIYLNQSNRAVQNLDWGPIGYLGMISYGVYMYQGLLTGNGPYRSIPFWPPEPWIGALLTFPVAALSFHFFEKPVASLRKRLPATAKGNGRIAGDLQS